MSLEITGRLLIKYDTQVISDKFKKREFVLELAEEINGNIYTNYAKLQLVQTKCDIIDKFNVGEMVKVSFNVKGTKYEKDGKVSYFSNLDAWRVEYAAAPGTAPAPSAPAYSQPAPAYNQPAPGGYNNPGGNYGQQSNNASSEPVDDLPF